MMFPDNLTCALCEGRIFDGRYSRFNEHYICENCTQMLKEGWGEPAPEIRWAGETCGLCGTVITLPGAAGLCLRAVCFACLEKVHGPLSGDYFPFRFGYLNLAAMREASTIVEAEGPDIDWYVTPSLVVPGQWVAWDDSNPADPGYMVCESRDDAIAFHREAFTAEYGEMQS